MWRHAGPLGPRGGRGASRAREPGREGLGRSRCRRRHPGRGPRRGGGEGGRGARPGRVRAARPARRRDRERPRPAASASWRSSAGCGPRWSCAPTPTALYFGDGWVNHRDHRVCGFAVLDAVAPAAASPHYFPDAGPPHQVRAVYLPARSSRTPPWPSPTCWRSRRRRWRATRASSAPSPGQGELVHELVEQRAMEAGQALGVAPRRAVPRAAPGGLTRLYVSVTRSTVSGLRAPLAHGPQHEHGDDGRAEPGRWRRWRRRWPWPQLRPSDWMAMKAQPITPPDDPAGHDGGEGRAPAPAATAGPRAVVAAGVGHDRDRMLGPVRVVVVLPTYNEAENIVDVLRRVRAAVPDAGILVVDDNSPDGTADLAEASGAGDRRRHPGAAARRQGRARLGLPRRLRAGHRRGRRGARRDGQRPVPRPGRPAGAAGGGGARRRPRHRLALRARRPHPELVVAPQDAVALGQPLRGRRARPRRQRRHRRLPRLPGHGAQDHRPRSRSAPTATASRSR